MAKFGKTPKRIPQWYVVLRAVTNWIMAQLFFGFLGLVKLLPADAAINTIERLGRWFGMRYQRTRRARDNLVKAFPQKSGAEIETHEYTSSRPVGDETFPTE